MSPKTLLCLMPLSLFLSLSGCGVLFPERAERPPVVLTKVETKAQPILLDTSCPPAPTPPPKPQGHNTLAKDAANYVAELDSWAMACRDLNDALDAILRPSTEATTNPKQPEGNP